jgi:hypothetical protein
MFLELKKILIDIFGKLGPGGREYIVFRTLEHVV